MPLPLLRLPENLTVDVLRTFGMRELLTISILSKRANKAVKLLKIKTSAHLYISKSIKLEVHFFGDVFPTLILEFYTNLRKKTALNVPKKVTVTTNENEITDWYFPSSKLTMKGWRIRIDESYVTYFEVGFEIFDFDSLKKALSSISLQCFSISENIPNEQSIMLLKTFLPYSWSLRLERNPFQKEEYLRAILIQNQEFFCLGSQERFTDFTLNDMLMCNFALFSIHNPTWTDSDLNRFFKLCIKGACPNLCQLEFRYLQEDWRWNQEEVLKGISYKEFTGDRGIGVFGDNILWSINGGYDIQGMDGRICSIEVVEPRRVNFWFWGLY